MTESKKLSKSITVGPLIFMVLVAGLVLVFMRTSKMRFRMAWERQLIQRQIASATLDKRYFLSSKISVRQYTIEQSKSIGNFVADCWSREKNKECYYMSELTGLYAK